MNILEKVAITECNSLSDNLLAIGIFIGVIGVLYLSYSYISYSSYKSLDGVSAKKEYKKFFTKGITLYFICIFIVVFSSLPFPFLLQETGKYKYVCTFDNSVTANYISENYKVIGVKDGKWILEDK